MPIGSSKIPFAKSDKLRSVGLRFERGKVVVVLDDGREMAVPLSKYPTLQRASATQRRNWEIIGDGDGFGWDDLDLHLSTLGLVNGYPERIPKPPAIPGMTAPKVLRRRSA